MKGLDTLMTREENPNPEVQVGIVSPKTHGGAPESLHFLVRGMTESIKRSFQPLYSEILRSGQQMLSGYSLTFFPLVIPEH